MTDFIPSPTAADPPGLKRPSGRFEPTTFLSDVVLELGLADAERVDAAVQTARNPGHTLEAVLLESQVLTEEQLAYALAERHDIAHLDLAALPSDPAVEELLDFEVARRHEALPVARLDEQTVLLAMADPADWLAADEISRLIGSAVRRAAAARGAVCAAIEAASERRRQAARHHPAPRPEDDPGKPSHAPSVPAAGGAQPAAPPDDPAGMATPPASVTERADLERWLLERSLAERAARLERERAELERERAELLGRPAP